MTMVGAMAAQWVAKRVMMNPPPLLTASTSSASTLISPWLPVVCGRGDRKTKKGKRFRGTYGNCRPKKDKKIERIKERVEVPPSTPWPLPFKLV